MNENRTSPEGGTVLYGVPKVGYCTYGGVTPLPICLKACANYLGEDVDYDYVMATSGAGFRLTWDTECWNGGNVDVLLAYDDPTSAFRNGVEALGREFQMLGRNNRLTTRDPAKFSTIRSDANKQDFIDFIRREIDKGRPVLALGMIGPPEACIVTGYRDEGRTLLGWNFFQDSPEFKGGVRYDESGYFITDTWWENEETIAVISIGERVHSPAPLKRIIANAIEVLTGRMHMRYAKGILAYDAWKKAISDDSQFPKDAIMPILVERLMCQGDAMDCLADGRHNVSAYFKKLAQQMPDLPILGEIGDTFGIVADRADKMYRTLGGWERGEAQMKALARAEIRSQLCTLIDQCKQADERALELLKQLERLEKL